VPVVSVVSVEPLDHSHLVQKIKNSAVQLATIV
jgi:hypothetical protein